MRCGKISVEGEAEEIAVSPRPRFCQKHVKKPNPYSSRGLDKFETVYAELSAKREYVAKKVGVSEDQVRFSFSKDGWTPVVMRTRDGTGKKNSGEGAAGVSIPGSGEKKNRSRELRGKDERSGRSEGISIAAFDARSHSLVMPFSRFLRTTAFGLFGLSAIWARRSAVPSALTLAAAMAVSGVMCMKKFIWGGISICAALFRNLRNTKRILNGGSVEAIAEQKDVDMGSRTGNPQTTQNIGGIEEIAEQKDVNMGSRSRNPKTAQNVGGIGEIAEKKYVDMVSRKIPRADHLTTVSAPCSPMRAHVQPTEFSAMASPRAGKLKEVSHEHKHHHNNHHHHNSKAKIIRRIVSMDSRPTRSVRPQGPDIFYRRTRPAMAYDASVGATSLIIILLSLAFFGRLYAIFFTSAWWYFLPMFSKPSEMMNTKNSNSKVVDHQSSENRKKVIMDGLLGRRRQN